MRFRHFEKPLLLGVSILLSAGLLAAAAVSHQAGGFWPMWGGTPGRNMVNTTEMNMPSEWDVVAGKNVKWKADLGSQSYGNPVIAGGKILVGTNNLVPRDPEIQGDKGVVMCFREEDGAFLWQAVHDKLRAGRVNDWPLQGICSSPLVDGDRVYYISNRCEVVCVDLEGFRDGENDGAIQDEKLNREVDADFIWKLDMMKELGVFPHNLAVCSPLVVGDLVFVVTGNGVDAGHLRIPSARAPSFIAVNKNTGEVVWYDRSPGRKILHGQWANPAHGVVEGKAQVYFPGGDGWLYAFEPKTGDLIWKFDCNPKDSKWELGGRGTRNSLLATPVFHDNKVYMAVGQDPEHGYGVGHLWCIDATKSGDVTEAGLVWHYGGDLGKGEFVFGRTMSTVAIDGDLLFAAELTGFLHCLDLKTGKPHWKYDMLASVWGSPYVVDGKVYLGDEDGDVAVFEAKPELNMLTENIMTNTVYSTPVAAAGVLYVMQKNRLYALQQQ